MTDAVAAVASGQADATIDAEPVIQHIIDKEGFINLKYIDATFNAYQAEFFYLQFGIRKDLPILQTLLNKSLQSIPASERRQMTAKWFPTKNNDSIIELDQKEKGYLRIHSALKVSGAPDLIPIDFIDQTSSHQGIMADLLSLISERTGIKMTFIPTETVRETLTLAQNNEIDLISQVSKNNPNNGFLNYTKPILNAEDAVFMRQNENLIFNLEQLREKRIGLIQGSQSDRFMMLQFPESKITYYKNSKEGLEALNQGAIDAWFDNLLIAGNLINKEQMFHIKIAQKLPYQNLLYIGVNKSLPKECIFRRT